MPNPNSNDAAAVVDQLDPETQPAGTQDRPADPAAGAHPAAAAPAQQDEVFTEEIDLGNGNVLKFEAPTQDELREKIFGWMRDKATAAPSPASEGTQPGAAGSQPAPAKKPKELTKAEAFAIDTEFKSGSPIKALRDYVEKVYGATLDQIVENAERGGEYSRTKSRFEREQAAVSQFLKNLEAAVRELGNAGLLAKEPEGNPNGANPEPAKKKAASGLFGKTSAPSRPAAPGAKKVMSEAELQKMVGGDAAEAFDGIEPFDGAANQAAPDPADIDFSRLRLGLLANKPEDNPNPNPDPGANPEPVKERAASGLFGEPGASSRPAAPGAKKVMSEAELQKMVGGDAAEAFDGIEPFDGAANQAARDPVDIDFSRLRLGLLANKPEDNPNPNPDPGANPEPVKERAASGLFGEPGASSRPAAPANEVIREAEMQKMVGDDAAEAFGGIEPFDGAANQAAPDPVASDFVRLRLGLLANKPEGNLNPNPDPGANPEPAEKKAGAEMQQMAGDDAAEAFGGIEPFDGAANQAARLRLGLLANKPEGIPDPGANPEPAKKRAGAEMQQMVGDDAAEAFGGTEPFDGAANQAAPGPFAIDFSRLRSEPLVGGSGITLLVNLSSRRQQFFGNLRAALGPAGEPLPLECEMGRFSWRGTRASVILHAAIVSVLMVLPAIPRARPVIVEEKHTDYIPIYRAVESLPSKRTVQVLRTAPITPYVVDAREPRLPVMPTTTANLLTLLPAPSAPSPVLSAPVELVRNPSKITWPDRRPEPSGVDAPRLRLTSGTVANLVRMPSPASPVLGAPVELVRNPSKIARPDRRRELSAVDAPRLQLTPGTVANHPASAIVATLASHSKPRLAIPKTAIVVEASSNTTPDLHMVPVTPLPVLPEARRKDVPIAVVATSRSGGGLKAYGAFKNRMVYTIYIDTAAGRVVLQFAAQNSTGAYAAGLTPPDPLITDMPSAISGSGVVFSGVLDTAGQFQNIRMMAGSAPNQVLEALRRWRFHPVLIGKQPVAVDALIGIGIDVR